MKTLFFYISLVCVSSFFAQEIIEIDEVNMKIKIYIPEWKRAISTVYKKLSDTVVYSRDEKREIDVSDFREIEVNCAFNVNARNWKERVIINIS